MSNMPFSKPAVNPERGSIEWMLQDAQNKGYVYADRHFVAWVNAVIGKPVGDLFESVIANTRGWMSQHGLKVEEIRLDHLIAYAFVGVERPWIVRNEGGFSASIDAINQSASFKKWFASREVDVTDQATNVANWIRGSAVVDANGEPLAMYHGTGKAFDEFKGMAWGSADRDFANEYAELREYYGGEPRIIKMYMNIKSPFNADALGNTLRVSDFFAELLNQSPDMNQDVMQELRQTVLIGARTEESGPHYSPQHFWSNTSSYFGTDGAQAIQKAFIAAGFDGIKFTEQNVITYGAFSNNQVMIVPEDDMGVDAVANTSEKMGADEFAQWFGNSTITADGAPGSEPLIVYHGTSSSFTEFAPSSGGEYGPGIYLSYRKESAAMWGAIAGGKGGDVRVIPLYLKMEKPYRTTKLDLIDLTLEEDEDEEPIGMREVHRRLKAEGYDGIIGTGLSDSDVQIIAFDASQIQFADEVNVNKEQEALAISEAAKDNSLLDESNAFDLSYAIDGNSLRQYKIGDTTIIINAMRDEISLSSIRTPQRKRGNGSAKRALQALISQADKEGVTITLGASPLDAKTNTNKLVSLYESMGFRLTGRSINPMGDPEMIRNPFGVNLDDISLPIDVLTSRNVYVPISSMTPAEATDLPLGSIRIASFGDEDERYVDVLRNVPVASLLLAEPEDNIKKTREFQQYVQWAREGLVAPSIQVNESDRGELVTTNRRRALAAKEAGIKTLKAWVSPVNQNTGDPLKFGDLKKLILSADKTLETNDNMTPSESAIEVFAYHGTPNSFTEFDTLPAFFTTDYDAANAYAENQYAREGEEGMPRVLSATIRMNNPKVYDGADIEKEFDDGNGEVDWYQFEMYFYELEDQGYDGVIVHNITDYAGGSGDERKVKKYDQIAVFNSYQITIIDGNVSPESAKEKEFKDWFSGSVMKNNDGTPMTLFHGSRPGNDIHKFDINKHDGAYFTPDIHYAEGFTEGLFGDEIGQHGAVYPVFLSVKSPYVVRTVPESDEWEKFCYRGLNKAELESQGYDSAVLYLNGELDQVIAFHPEQIRFALTSSVPVVSAELSTSISQGEPKDDWMTNSKIINNDGSPKVVFHGSNQKFDFFDEKRKAQSTFNKASEEAFWFTDSQFVAREYAYYASKTVPSGIADYEAEFERITNLMNKAEKKGNWDDYERYTLQLEELDANALYEPEGVGTVIYPVHLSLKNPMVLDVSEDISGFYERGGNHGIVEEAKRLGHDGVIFNNHNDTPTTGTVSTHYAVFNVDDIRFERKVNGLDNLFIDADSEPYVDITPNNKPLVVENKAIKRVLTESALMIEVGVNLPMLAPIFESLLEKGRRGEKGGFIIISSDDNHVIAGAISAKTGMSLDDSLKATLKAAEGMVVHDDNSGLTFITSKDMNVKSAVAAIMSGISKTTLGDRIEIDANKLFTEKDRFDECTKAFLERAEMRLKESGQVASPCQELAIIIEQAVMEHITSNARHIDLQIDHSNTLS